MQRSDSIIATRWGRSKLRSAVAVLALSCTTLVGHAHDRGPDVDITVTPIPATVNLRVGASTTQAAYRVEIVNRSPQALNEVRFVASTRISPAASPTSTRYVDDDSDECGLAPGSQTVVKCNFGKLRGAGRSGASGVSFVVVFEVPTSGERLHLDWTAYYREGAKDNRGRSSPTNDSQSSADPGKAVFTQLVASAADSDKQARSYFAASTGALLFTNTGEPSAADPWTTTVSVPPGTAGEARIVEDSDPNSCSAVIPECVRSAVSVPGSFVGKTSSVTDPGFLVITLRRDASTIPKGALIEKAPLWYEPGDIDAGGVFQPSHPGSPGFPIRLKLCKELGGAPSVPAPGTPPAEAEQQKRCIKSFQAYPWTSSPKTLTAPTTPPNGLSGDWEWVIWAIENGRISF